MFIIITFALNTYHSRSEMVLSHDLLSVFIPLLGQVIITKFIRNLLTLGEEKGFCLTLLLRDTEAVANTVYFPVTVS